MINNYLFDTIINKCKQEKTKIIFLADAKQLKPVNEKSISKVFNKTDGQFKLTTNHR